MVVYPKIKSKSDSFPNRKGPSSANNIEMDLIDPQDIKPLIFEKVVVKAKKYKEKDGLDIEEKILSEDQFST